MTINTMTQAVEALAAAKPGDTLVYDGTFDYIPLKNRPANLTIDFTAGISTTQTRTGTLDGLTIHGGLFRQGIGMSGGKNLTIEGATFQGDETRAWNGVTVTGVAGVYVRRCLFRDCANGVVLGQVSGFEIDDNDFERVRRDIINLTSVQMGKIRRNKSRDQRSLDGDHADAAQMLNVLGQTATADVLFEDNDFDIARGQGPTPTWKVASGAPRFARITYRRNHIKAGAPYGLGGIAVDGLILDSNTVETLPGSLYQSRIVVDPSCTDVTWIGTNVQAAYADKPAFSYPPTVVAPPPPPADPRDVALADAQAKVAELEASLATALSAGADANATVTTLTAELSAANAGLAAMQARVDAAMAALTAT